MCKITKDKAFLLIFAFLSLILVLMILFISQMTIREIDYENVVMNNNTQKQINLLNERVMKLEGKNNSNNQNNNSTTVQYLEPGDCSPYVSLLEEIGDGEIEKSEFDFHKWGGINNIKGKGCKISIQLNGLQEDDIEWSGEDWLEKNQEIINQLTTQGWSKYDYTGDALGARVYTFTQNDKFMLFRSEWESDKFDITKPVKLYHKDIKLTFTISIGEGFVNE